MVIQSEARSIGLTFVGRDETIMSDLDVRHLDHMENRKARWEKEEEQLKDEYSDES